MSQAIADLMDLRQQVIPNGHASLTNLYVQSAQGSTITSVDGKKYIDFAGGIAVMNVGHSHPKVVTAIQDQAGKFTHTCFMVNPYGSTLELAARLAKLTPGDFAKKTLFVNSGAEAVENAVKIARYYTKRSGVVVFENGYHGRTLLTMTMTSKVKPYKFGFGPFAPEVYRMPFGDTVGADKLHEFFVKHINPEDIACVVAEPVQGEGGFICPPMDYFQKLHQICKDNGILLIADEIQSGMGRTGKMFAMEHWGVEPELTTVAKSLAAGMPLAAVVGKQEIMDSVHPGGLGGTYGANPVAVRAALAVLDIYEEENILGQSLELGGILKTRFEKWQRQFQAVGELRGLGAMAGFTIVKGGGEPAADKAKELAAYCFDHGLVILVCGMYGNVIRVLAPLTISEPELSQGLEVLEQGLAQISG
jgi:4-aminobutyrate aminotransferase/(S)-3-amino-2-methylpropionate transaminase